jgi:hypothetical protein
MPENTPLRLMANISRVCVWFVQSIADRLTKQSRITIGRAINAGH